MGSEREGLEDGGLTHGPASTVGLHGLPGRPLMEGHAQSTGCSCHLGNILFPFPTWPAPPAFTGDGRGKGANTLKH